jgi:hypothetical protein
MVVVTIPFAERESADELIILVEVATPLMVDVRVFTADWRSLVFTKRAVVVAI